MKILLKTAVLLLQILMLSFSAPAQNGRWVSCYVDTLGIGDPLYDVGDKCACYTTINSRYFLIFDADTGVWTTVRFDKEQYFRFAGTQGHVIMGWSDEILLGYSDVLKKTDTLRYEGTVLHVESNFENCSYGYSNNLAFFVTDKQFYVFDAMLGYWQNYDYGLPNDYVERTGVDAYFPRDDYVVLSIPRSGGLRKNVVYSFYTKSFSKLDDGCNIFYNYKGGFAGCTSHDGYAKDFTLIGYSAFTNQFKTESYTIGDETRENAVLFSAPGSGLYVDTLIAYGCTFREVVTAGQLVRFRYYGYSTLLGEWNKITNDVDWSQERYSGDGLLGGRYTVDYSLTPEGKTIFYLFNATNNHYMRMVSDLDHAKRIIGGTVFGAYDETRIWGYNPATETGTTIHFPAGAITGNVAAGEDFLTISSRMEGADVMTIHFFNARTNHWSSVEVPENHTVQGLQNSRIYIHTASPEYNVVVYSSFLDSIMTADFSDAGYVIYGVNGIFAYVLSEGRSILFNTESGNRVEKSFQFIKEGIGKRSAVLVDKPGRVLYGYSAISEECSEKVIGEEPWYINGGMGNVGIVSGKIGTDNYAKYYVYNGLHDCWNDLTPESDFVDHRLGQNTVLIVREENIYVYDPYKDQQIQDTLFDISGSVLTPERDPVTEGRVNVFHPKTDPPGALIWNVPLAGKNEFTVVDIPQGQVTLRVDPDTSLYPGYLNTYLGNISVWWDADFFELTGDTSGLDIMLVPKPVELNGTCEVSGRLVREVEKAGNALAYGFYDGSEIPLKNIPVFLSGQEGILVAYNVTNEDGEFSFRNIPAGSYAFLADTFGIFMSEQNDSLEIAAENQKYYVTAVLAGDTIRLEIANITGVDVPGKALPVMIYPNPVRDHLFLKFWEGIAGKIIIRITGVDGRLVRVCSAGPFAASAVLDLPVTEMTEGIYLLTVSGDLLSYRTRIMKISR
ncbi:MAG: hypothetical protein J7K46_01480 [Bacteroidales bacterium]|nr:hypothetical protein [Bacteroidales bacterium]